MLRGLPNSAQCLPKIACKASATSIHVFWVDRTHGVILQVGDPDPLYVIVTTPDPIAAPSISFEVSDEIFVYHATPVVELSDTMLVR